MPLQINKVENRGEYRIFPQSTTRTRTTSLTTGKWAASSFSLFDARARRGRAR